MSAAHEAGLGLSRGRAALIVACFAAGYLMSYALRAINAVLAPVLQADLGLGPADLGTLASAFFLGFALIQWPLGVVLDRLGARRVDAALMLLAALGCALFAWADSLLGLWWGRALIGAGVSAAFMSALTAFRHRFAPERQGALAAGMLVAGSAGALLVTVPLEWALPGLGWRGVFGLAAAVLVCVALALWWGVPPDAPKTPCRETVWQSLQGYRLIYREPLFWRMALPAAVVQGGFVAMQTLWIGPWWGQVLGASRADIAQQLLALNLTLLAAYIVVGRTAQHWSATPARLMRVVAGATAVIVLMELLIAQADGPQSWLLWLLYGAAATPYIVVQPWLALSYPDVLAGRALTGFNLVIFLAMFASQWVFGLAVEALMSQGWNTVAAFRGALMSLAALHVLSGLAFVWGPLARAYPARR